MEEKVNISKRYESINGLRTIACIGILMMHVMANSNYNFNNSIFTSIINEMTNFVFLFMVISSFGMCCGYYEKIKNNQISIENFYKKRISKILPFFIFLIIIDIIYERSISSVIEGFADSTLMFGFLQKDIKVVGVGWFIGLVFIFYMMFPYFVFLFSNKRRAWIVTGLALIMNFISTGYFKVGRTNMFYSFIYFCFGGLLYLYKDNIIIFFKDRKFLNLLIVLLSLICYFVIAEKAQKYIYIYIYIIRAIIPML